jgi:hypothetical protein
VLALPYIGTVEANDDPLKLGRLKVRVPCVYGVSSAADGSGYIARDDLPWALPAGMPAGGSHASGGFSMLPEPGDQVMVQFLDGEPENPVWQWLMQTRAQADKLKLHHYGQKGRGEVGAPDRAILSRYGHSLELTESSVTLTTSQGYQIRLENSTGETGGSAAIQTPAGQRISLNDLNKGIVAQALDSAVVSAGTVILNAASDMLVRSSGSLSLAVGGVSVIIDENTITLATGTRASVIIDDAGNIAIMSAGGAALAAETDRVQASAPDGTGVMIKNGKISVSAGQIVINTSALAVGTDAQYPAVMLTPSLLRWITTHTHNSSAPGVPTGPPILLPPDPEFPVNSGSTRVRLT